MPSHHLYRHFNASGDLLYVGVSLSTVARLKQHRTNSNWFELIDRITIERFKSRDQALEAERKAIETETPLHNIMFNKVVPLHQQKIRTRAVDSREELLARVTRFNPIYRVADAAALLSLSEKELRGFMDSGHLGWVEFPSGRWGTRRRITGWQIIDFIENWEQAEKVRDANNA